MANPPQPTVKIGLAMASPYAIPIFVMKIGKTTPFTGFQRVRRVVHRLSAGNIHAIFIIFCLFNYGQALYRVRRFVAFD